MDTKYNEFINLIYTASYSKNSIEDLLLKLKSAEIGYNIISQNDSDTIQVRKKNLPQAKKVLAAFKKTAVDIRKTRD